MIFLGFVLLWNALFFELVAWGVEPEFAFVLATLILVLYGASMLVSAAVVLMPIVILFAIGYIIRFLCRKLGFRIWIETKGKW